eukprot:19161_1
MDQQQAHAEKMNMDHQQAEIKSANKKIKKMQKMQERTIVDIRVAKEKEDQLQENYLRHKAKHEEDLAVIVKKIELAQLKYAESNDKIRDVINRTNLDEGSIPQFLNLINDGLIVGTLNDTAKREELNAKLGAFAELVERRTSTTMEIDTYFKGKLDPFVQYLRAEEYASMNDILCKDDNEFNEILGIIEKGIDAENKEIEEYNENLDTTNAEIAKNNAEIDEKVSAIDAKITSIGEEINRLKEQKALEKEEAKEEEIAIKLNSQQELLTLKQNEKDALLKQKQEPGKPKTAIHAIRTKQTKGGPIYQKLRKLCLREIAEGPKGWVTKNDGDDEVEVETIFKGKLKPFAKYLADEAYDTMDMVLCDDEDEFEERLNIIEAGIAKDKGRPLKRGTSGKETSVMRTLKQMCMKENAEEGWMKQQQAKKAIVTVQLKEVSHPLSKFFGAMDMAVTDARSCLEYSVQKTPAQQSAIEYRKKNEAKLKAIKEKAENAAPDDDDDEAKNEEPQFLAEFRESRENGLTQNPTDMDEEKAGALDLIRDESSAFVTAAILKLHVVDAVRHIFEASELPITIETGLTLAQDVENCSLQIMQSQATIRSSLLIARQLVEFKPAKPDPQAAPFWEVIDTGIITIFNSYIEMTKTSATYFSFFAKFKSAMQHFEAFHEIQGDCIDVSAASIYLKRELKAFAAFGTKMKVAVDRLRGDAIAVINDCVRETRCPNNSYYLAQNARKEAAAELYRYISL